VAGSRDIRQNPFACQFELEQFSAQRGDLVPVDGLRVVTGQEWVNRPLSSQSTSFSNRFAARFGEVTIDRLTEENSR